MPETPLQRHVRDALAPPRPTTRDPRLPIVGRTGYERSTGVYCFCRSLARLVGTMFQDLKVYDVENVPLAGGVVLVSNHQSYVDPIFIAAKLPRVLSFLAKSELFKPWGFRWLIRQCNAFPVRQGSGDVGAMKQSIALLQSGKALLIFPEGSRSEDGELAPIAGGSALVVKRAKVPVVPVAIEGAFDVWSVHAPFPRTGRVRIKFGKPILLHELDGRAIVAAIDVELRKLIVDLRTLEARERAEARMPPRTIGE